MNGERTRAACLKASFADYAITTPVRQRFDWGSGLPVDGSEIHAERAAQHLASLPADYRQQLESEWDSGLAWDAREHLAQMKRDDPQRLAQLSSEWENNRG